MVFEAGERLCDDGMGAAGKAQDGGEMVGHAGAARVAIAEREHRHRVAETFEVPHDEVEEVDGLFENPGADARGVVAPSAGARAEREAKEREADVLRDPDLAGVDHRLHATVLGRQAQLVADAKDAAARAGGGEQAVAVLQRRRHRLLEQHVLAGVEGGHADLRVQVVGHDDRDRVDVAAGEQRAVADVHRRRREIARGGSGGRLAGAGDSGEGGARRGRDRGSVMAAPEAVADQTEAHGEADTSRPRRS